MKKVRTALLVILIVVICALAVGFFMTFYNPKTKQIARFYLQYDKQIVTDSADIIFPREIVELKAKHTFAFAESDTSFTLKIVPNTEHDFSFRVGEVEYKFSELEDLTEAFTIIMTDDGFTLDVTEITPQSVLNRLFLSPVTLPEDMAKECYFRLVATSANGQTVTVNFRAYTPVSDLQLSPNDEEVFYF